jgi:hypothetical protein
MVKHRHRIPRSRSQQSSHFVREKSLIEKYYPGFNCSVRRNLLVCHGIIVPADGCESYHVTIKYRFDREPHVWITEPAIRPSAACHMYEEDGSLCLYDHRESPWHEDMMVHQTIIPWTAEWIVFYELWKLTGEWLGPAAPHGSGGKTREKQRGKLASGGKDSVPNVTERRVYAEGEKDLS